MDTTWFGGSCWSSSPDEEYLVYGAEPASSDATTTPSFYSSHSKDGDDDNLKLVGADCTEDIGIPLNWGEGYVDMHPMITLFVVQIATGRILPVNHHSKHHNQQHTHTLG